LNNYIADENIHTLSKDFGYILKEFDEIELINTTSIHEISIEFIRKYAEYIYEFDKEKVIEILVNKFSPTINGCMPEEVQLIYRPQMKSDSLKIDGVLLNKASLALKFKRAKNDNLDSNL